MNIKSEILYFILVLFVMIVLLIYKPIPAGYVSILYIFLTFVIFLIQYVIENIRISNIIKKQYPELYKKHRLKYSWDKKGFKNDIYDFGEIASTNNIDLSNRYEKVQLYKRLFIISFFLWVPLSILSIVI